MEQESKATNVIDLGDVEKRTININFVWTTMETIRRGFFFTLGSLTCIALTLFLGDLANRLFG